MFGVLGAKQINWFSASPEHVRDIWALNTIFYLLFYLPRAAWINLGGLLSSTASERAKLAGPAIYSIENGLK